jgi:hypothetical protein
VLHHTPGTTIQPVVQARYTVGAAVSAFKELLGGTYGSNATDKPFMKLDDNFLKRPMTYGPVRRRHNIVEPGVSITLQVET